MTNNSILPPFRVDHVGSFLRPENLKAARLAYTNGDLSRAELTSVEDAAISELVAKQKELGLKSITDGEFRRGYWHIDFLENLDGVEGYVPTEGYNQTFKGDKAPDYNIRVISPVAFPKQHPFLDHFQFLQKEVANSSKTDAIAKATIPSPTMLIRQELLAKNGPITVTTIYPDLTDFYQDIVATYQDAVKAFYEIGCRYLQFDDTNWAFLIDQEKRKEITEKGFDPSKVAALCTDLINQILTVKPADMVITTHICRGNHASSWIFSGGYEPIAKELFETNYDGFFLEYDSERAGDFSPLRHWKTGKVVLGLVTSKFPELEDPEAIKSRITEATKYIPLEELALSPQCGFSSTEVGNKLTTEDQWKKIKLIQTIAADVWPN